MYVNKKSIELNEATSYKVEGVIKTMGLKIKR